MTFAPEDIVNMALATIGYDRRIGDLYEGTHAARIALDIYGESRDEVLRLHDWAFARRSITLSLLKSAGTPLYGGGQWTTSFPPIGWLYEYACPSDLILMRYVASSPTSFPVMTPKAVRFTFYNDPTVLNSNSQAARCILSNINPAICNYTGQVLDPSTWEPLFLNAVVERLADKFKYALSTQPELLAKELPEQEMASAQIADSRGP